MNKAGKRNEKLFPFSGNDNRSQLIVPRTEMLFDRFCILIDFVNGFSRSGIAAFEFDQNPALPILSRQYVDEAARSNTSWNVFLNLDQR